MMASYGFFELKAAENEKLLHFLKNNKSFSKVTQENGLITAFLNEEMNSEVLNRSLMEQGIALSHLVKRKESLEEQFLALTNNAAN